MSINFQYGGKDIILLQYLEERLEKDPGSALFAMLSYFYLSLDKVAEALSIAQRGVIVHPNYSTGHAVLAMAMMRAGFYRDARKELLKAADLHPGSKMIEMLSEEVERQEQADAIGRRIAEQYRKRVGPDIMKTVEETLKSNPIKPSDEDLLIPGLESIIGEESQEMPPGPSSLPGATAEVSRDYDETGGEKSETLDLEYESSSAREIIDRVTREFADKISSDLDSPDRAEKETTATDSRKRADLLNLDALARELDSAGPIQPETGTTGSLEEDKGIELTPDIVTDTLAEILEHQGQFDSAVEAYNILLEKRPEHADFYRKKIAELESRTNEEH